MLYNLVKGLQALDNGPAIVYLVAGSLVGVFIGVVPGLSGAVVLTIVLAFVYHISLTGTLCLFLATQAGSYFSASITSILLNTPAHPEAFAVTFDGFPMAQRGEAGRALGISATSTCIGGLIGCAVLVGFIQIINDLPLLFHPPEEVALITLALLLVGTVGTDRVSKALISLGIAIMLSSIGTDDITGVFRYTFGAINLVSGLSIVALFLGLFAIPQMIFVYGTSSAIARQNLMGEEIARSDAVPLEKGFGRQVVQGMRESFQHIFALTRAALVGVVTGVIPGIGGFAANFMSYGIAQQLSKNREAFGTGIPEGIIAPEGSSLAKEAGGMVPVLGLGIPGGIGAALFLAALAIKGVKTGYGFTTLYPVLAYETVWIIALGGVIGTAAGLLAAPWLARVTRIPGPVLLPIIVGISIVGTYASDVAFFSVVEMAVFALVGFVLRRLRYSLAVFGVGLILGPTLETNIYLTHNVYPGVSFLKDRPLATVLFVLAIALLIGKSMQIRHAVRKANAPLDVVDPEERAAELRKRDSQRYPYPLLALIATSVIVVVCTWFAVYGGTQYHFTTALFPVLGSGVAAVTALWRLPFEIAGYVRYRQDRREVRQLEVAAASAGRERMLVLLEERSRVAAVAGTAVGEHLPELSAEIVQGDATVALGESGEAAPVRANAAASSEGERGLPEIVDKSWSRHGQYTREAVAFAWFLLLIGACYVLDFVVAVPLFCVLYGMLSMRRVLTSLKGRVLFSVCTAAVLWLVTYEIQTLLHISFSPLLHL